MSKSSVDARPAINGESKALIRRVASLEKQLKALAGAVAALTAQKIARPVETVPIPKEINEIALRVLEVLVSSSAADIRFIPREWLSILVGMSVRSSGFSLAVSTLFKGGWATIPVDYAVGLTNKGRPWETAPPVPFTRDELVRRMMSSFVRKDSRFDKTDGLMLTWLVKTWNGGAWLSKAELATATGQGEKSSRFEERLTALRADNLIEFGQRGTLRATLQWGASCLAETEAA